MNGYQLLVLGNGFDLHCGLKSSYRDFFRSEILDTYSERCGYPKLKESCQGFWENLLFEYYKKNDKADYTWCVIENIIKDTLVSLFVDRVYGGTELCELAYKYADSNKKAQEIISSSPNNSIDLFLLGYSMEFFRRANKKSVQSFIAHLYQELNSFERRFCKYLKNQIINPENERNEEYLIKSINLLAYITGFSNIKYDDIKNIIHKEERCFEKSVSLSQKVTTWKNVNILSKEFAKLKSTNILSFNYTALFDILNVDSPCVYNNVHGKLCDIQCTQGCNVANIIFGIDDNLIQSQGANLELRLFSKTYRKMLNSDKDLIALPPNNEYPIGIKFYGHSLSEADYSYFQSIFDYYDLYGNSNVVLTFYYSKGFENYDAAYKLISIYGRTLTNKEQGKNLLHKLLLENRLHIQQIKD